MAKNILVVVALLMAFVSVGLYETTETSTAVTVQAVAETVSVEGSRVTISLDGNPTTGYEWTYVLSDEAILSELGSEYQMDENPSGVPGVGGMYSWTLKAEKAGDVDIAFAYARSFEPGVPPIQTVSFSFTVDAEGNISERP